MAKRTRTHLSDQVATSMANIATSPPRVEQMTPSEIGQLSTQEIGALSVSQIASLSVAQPQAFSLSDFSALASPNRENDRRSKPIPVQAQSSLAVQSTS